MRQSNEKERKQIMGNKGKEQRKVKKVMHKYSEGALKSSSCKKVTDKKQALAIAMSESGKSKKK